jgi:hypothetical protein
MTSRDKIRLRIPPGDLPSLMAAETMTRGSLFIKELDRRPIEFLHGTIHFRVQKEHDGPP